MKRTSLPLQRREFITGLGSAAAWPAVARAQQGLPFVGYVSPGTESEPNYTAAFRDGLRGMGFIPGGSVMIEYGWAEGQNDRLSGIAMEFARRRVDLIVVTTTAALMAAKAASKTIPVVFMISADPVAAGFVVSLNRPGGNLTGFYNLLTALSAKRLELLHEIVPAATLVAYLGNPTNAVATEAEVRNVQIAARALGLRLLILNASTASDIELAFATLSREHVSALLVGSDTLFWNRIEQVVALANRHAIPTIYDRHEFATAGGLMSYGGDFRAVMREVGIYAGRILKGDRPSDLPIQQITKVELAINAKSGKALGLTIPETLLATADEVIQ
jgi:putative tryptophan/tyrosine transport system substrate-binding protein